MNASNPQSGPLPQPTPEQRQELIEAQFYEDTCETVWNRVFRLRQIRQRTPEQEAQLQEALQRQAKAEKLLTPYRETPQS